MLQLRDELGMCDTHAARELALERFWSDHPRTPILEVADPGKAFAEGRYTVTFLWQDAEAEEVLLFANRITDECDLSASLMRRVPGTDLWHLSYRMRGDWRASYGFIRRLPGRPGRGRTAISPRSAAVSTAASPIPAIPAAAVTDPAPRCRWSRCPTRPRSRGWSGARGSRSGGG